ncbi:hypothetical protein [Paraoerskovia marina]|uniref:Uncharacterized protein n=1 Tax=Paraoerskovia marina TaxID=545619 RepID=A0A1H1QLL4_9CELL|nr:hypothetical protein [Paraoerskovia marina]SDS24276.1 hypothetical protein SAMN04489860_1117 [Paraoerskovia marina]
MTGTTIAPSGLSSTLATVRRISLRLVNVSAWLVFAMAWGQIATAGYGLFAIESMPMTEASSLDAHRTLGYATEFVGVGMMVFLLVAWPRWSVTWPAVTLFAVMLVQPVLQRLGDTAPILGAMHAANALVTIALAFLVARRAQRALSCRD